MDSQPRRHWFRFSLRTLFVLVTLVACWLGWQMKFIRDRKEMRAWIVANGGNIGNSDDLFFDDPFGESEVSARQVSWLRHLLGDKGVDYIELSSEHSEPVCQRIAKLFPESKIGISTEYRRFPVIDSIEIRGSSIEFRGSGDKTLLNDLQ